VGKAYESPGKAAFALASLGGSWLTEKLTEKVSEALRHKWKCSICCHTWKGKGDTHDSSWAWNKQTELVIPKFRRMTLAARNTFRLASSESCAHGSTSIQSQDLLFGLLETCQPSLLFDDPETTQALRAEIKRGFPSSGWKWADLRLSEEVERIVASAAEEAEQMGVANIGTEHLLLGILKEETASGAMAILHNRGLRLSIVRQKIRDGTFQQKRSI
jgi:hypothetical protein